MTFVSLLNLNLTSKHGFLIIHNLDVNIVTPSQFFPRIVSTKPLSLVHATIVPHTYDLKVFEI